MRLCRGSRAAVLEGPVPCAWMAWSFVPCCISRHPTLNTASLRSVASSFLRSSNFPGFSARGAAFGLNSLQLRRRAAHHIFPVIIVNVISVPNLHWTARFIWCTEREEYSASGRGRMEWVCGRLMPVRASPRAGLVTSLPLPLIGGRFCQLLSYSSKSPSPLLFVLKRLEAYDCSRGFWVEPSTSSKASLRGWGEAGWIHDAFFEILKSS